MRSLSVIFPLLFLGVSCSGSDDPLSTAETGGTNSGGAASGGTDSGGAASGGAVAAGGTTMTGGTTMAGGTTMTGGSDGAGGGATGGTPGSGGDAAGGDQGSGASGGDAATGGAASLEEFASGLHELFIHDACTGEQDQQDTCTHVQLIEEQVTFGGDPGTTYEVTLRVRGLFEPTTIGGGTAPLPEDPYFVIGGTVQSPDYAQWHIVVSEPANTYFLNHYPQTSHTIYQEDFEAPILVNGGSEIVVKMIDANDRQIDNGTAQDLPDRHQLIEGVTEEVLDGQVLRLDVVSVVEAGQ